MGTVPDETIDSLLKLVNTLAPYPDPQKRILLKALFARVGDEALNDVLRGVDTAKMRIQLREMQRSPQNYARKMP